MALELIRVVTFSRGRDRDIRSPDCSQPMTSRRRTPNRRVFWDDDRYASPDNESM